MSFITTHRTSLLQLITMIFRVLIILCIVNYTLGSDSELLALLEKTAGVYKDSSKVVGDLKKTVLVTGCNSGFLNHLLNFKCFADRLGMKFLVTSMDKTAHDFITKNTTMSSHYMSTPEVDEMCRKASLFRDKCFNLITARKKEAVHKILSLGYNVLFSDTDVAMVEDPLPYMLFNNVDYVHSLNLHCMVGDKWDFKKSKVEGNTGFYFVRSTPNTIKLWQHAFEAVPKFKGLDDQAVFWNVIRKSTDPYVLPLDKCHNFDSASDVAEKTSKDYLVSCYLDTCAFSSGMLSKVYVPEFTIEQLIINLKTMNEKMVTVHANYIKGNAKKAQTMKDYGFWLSNYDDKNVLTGNKECNDYIPFVSAPSNTVVKV